MIKFKLKKLMDDNNIGQRELSRITGIRQSTIGDYYNNTFKHISKENLDKLCKYFNCQVDDIIEYIQED
ncbi:helix-turn-helix transcriptional regulator [Clostridium paraputrificum]|uniref:helix-turn-helix domain-containing protein n=1 Tax=Clostridium paraputrificum TaxID=29363 RepID=UPI00232FF9A6|nr:helix-turn-helix transcriptional regulator [Clostridium paraputrificum]MDB2071404.1 helix-turn-helix transcriptional regulator [Clostridium paraputrificum]MDB2081683.1 helix-turn-helix transcriptional regulator [Clostridium paraputrificum]